MITELDLTILDYIRTYLTSSLGDALMPAVTLLGDKGLIWIVMAAVLLVFKRTRPLGAAIAAALILELICCNLIIKPLVARVRPYDIKTAIELIVAAPHDYSFPSGHTAASFAACGALFFGRKRLTGSAPRAGAYLWIPALVLALLISFSRLYLYVHYPTDVAAGILIGTVLGYAGTVIVSHISNRFAQKNAA